MARGHHLTGTVVYKAVRDAADPVLLHQALYLPSSVGRDVVLRHLGYLGLQVLDVARLLRGNGHYVHLRVLLRQLGYVGDLGPARRAPGRKALDNARSPSVVGELVGILELGEVDRSHLKDGGGEVDLHGYSPPLRRARSVFQK